jgi:arylformamidase
LQRLEDYPLSDFILPARVVEITDPVAVRTEALAGLAVPAGGALLLKTENSRGHRATCGVFDPDFVHLTPEAARWCVEQRLALVGLDYTTVDPLDSDAPAHRILLGAGLRLLEAINLQDVPPGDYTLICLPLRMKGAEGSPTRAVLLAD